MAKDRTLMAIRMTLMKNLLLRKFVVEGFLQKLL